MSPNRRPICGKHANTDRRHIRLKQEAGPSRTTKNSSMTPKSRKLGKSTRLTRVSIATCQRVRRELAKTVRISLCLVGNHDLF